MRKEVYSIPLLDIIRSERERKLDALTAEKLVEELRLELAYFITANVPLPKFDGFDGFVPQSIITPSLEYDRRYDSPALLKTVDVPDIQVDNSHVDTIKALSSTSKTKKMTTLWPLDKILVSETSLEAKVPDPTGPLIILIKSSGYPNRDEEGMRHIEYTIQAEETALKYKIRNKAIIIRNSGDLYIGKSSEVRSLLMLLERLKEPDVDISPQAHYLNHHSVIRRPINHAPYHREVDMIE